MTTRNSKADDGYEVLFVRLLKVWAIAALGFTLIVLSVLWLAWVSQ